MPLIVGPTFSESIYLFIDGAYLRTVCRDVFQPVFGDGYQFDYDGIRNYFGARRVFYYDCLDDVKRDKEDAVAFQKRVKDQELFFDRINSCDGWHVRYGTVSHGRRPQQKEVDVLLAVDMLTHSFYKNMTRVILLSGDKDFRPVVEAVVRLGTLVQLVYDPRITSKDLARATDSEAKLTISLLCNWMKLPPGEGRNAHFPHIQSYADQTEHPPETFAPKPSLESTGVAGTEHNSVRLYRGDGTFHVSIQTGFRMFQVATFADRLKLLGYSAKLFGDIAWQ